MFVSFAQFISLFQLELMSVMFAKLKRSTYLCEEKRKKERVE